MTAGKLDLRRYPLRRRHRVGIRLPDWSTGMAPSLLQGVREFQRRHEAVELSFDQPSGGDLPPSPIDANWEGDGLLVYRHSLEEELAWRERGVAVINLSFEAPAGSRLFPRVVIDNRNIGRLAAKHLADLGLKNFACVHESTRSYSQERLNGFAEEIKRMRGDLSVLAIPVSNFPPERRPEMIEEQLWKGLLALKKPCGILAKDDIAGVYTLRLLSKLGLSCPEETALMGVGDDLVFCHLTTPALTSIRFPGKRIGYEAMLALHTMIMGDEEAPTDGDVIEISAGNLVPRESTGMVVLEDSLVTQALQILRLRSPREPLQVNELSELLGVSRESLRQRFVSALGRTPKKEIDRQRMARLKNSLSESELNLDELASDFGFASADEVCRYVKRQTGMTPGEIRRLHSLRD